MKTMLETMNDYEIEEWIRSGLPLGSSPTLKQLTWRQHVQYAVGHIINDYYSKSPEEREQTSVQLLVERRWPKKQDGFLNGLHYWKAYDRVAEQLTNIFDISDHSAYPVALYEQWNTHVKELNIDLTIIFQAIWESKEKAGQFTIQKFMVDEDIEVIKAFVFMANVFWHSVYGEPPGSIEIYTLMSGRKCSFARENLCYRESLDYVYLLSKTAPYARTCKA
ncbi:hypothetical protein D3C78_1028160 [compost metagenome]